MVAGNWCHNGWHFSWQSFSVVCPSLEQTCCWEHLLLLSMGCGYLSGAGLNSFLKNHVALRTTWPLNWCCSPLNGRCLGHISGPKPRADSRLAPSQWGTSLQSNDVSHWIAANLEWDLQSHSRWYKNLIILKLAFVQSDIWNLVAPIIFLLPMASQPMELFSPIMFCSIPVLKPSH